MAVLGIVLIILAVVAGVGVVVSSTEPTTLEVFGIDFGVLVPTVFFLGAATGVAFAAGLWLFKKGLGRGYRRRKEVKELRQRVDATPTAPVTPAPDAGRATATDDTVVEGTDPSRAGHHRAGPS